MEELSAAGRPLPKNWLGIIAFIWGGQAVSMITSYAAGYAAIWYVTETTGSALALAAMTVCAYLPTGLISPFAGVVADKHSRKLIMIAADLGVGAVSLALGFVILFGEMSLGLLVVLVVARSVGQAFHSPAMMATMPLLVPDRHLVRINTLDQLLFSAASIGAPAFGILLYTSIGFHSVMFLDFGGACVAVAGLALAKIPAVRDETASEQNVLANMREGYRALAANKGVLMVVGFVIVAMIISAPLAAIFPLMTSVHFGGDGYAASITEAAYGIGMVVGSVILMATGGGKRLALLVAAGMTAAGVVTAACGFLPPSGFWAFAALCVVMAVAESTLNGPLITIAQRHVDAEKMGRVMGLLTALFTLASPVGVALGGALADGIGVAPFFVVDGIALTLLGIAFYLPKPIRALDHEKQEE